MTLKEKIMKLQTYKMHEGEDTVYVERDDVLKALEQEPCEDAISRKSAVSRISDLIVLELKGERLPTWNEVHNALGELPPVQPKYNAEEWCKTCSEYDHEKHCCPRYNGVIRKAVEEIKEPKTGYISIDDVMSVFDDFLRGEVDEDETNTLLEMLKDKAESEK